MSNADVMVRFPGQPSANYRRLTTAKVVFLVVAAAAPLAAMVGNMPLALGMPGGLGMPAAFLIVGLILLCFAAGYSAMSREVVSTGAFYTYIGKGLGKPAGVVAAYCAVLAYASITIGLAAGFGYFTALLFGQLGLTMSWMPCALAGILLISVMGYRSLDFSAKILAFFMAAEFAILASFDAAVLLKQGFAALPLSVWRPESFWHLSLGSVLPFAIISFTGFESAALYGEETADPRKSIPAATLASLIVIALFYLFTVWVVIGAVGTAQMRSEAATQGGNLLFTLTGQYGGPVLTDLTGAFFVISVLASFLALHNGSARYLFALGRDSLLPATLARFHPQFHSPHIASMVMTAAELLVVFGLGFAGVNPYLGIASGAMGLGTIGIIIMQMGCAIAVVGYYRGARGAWTTRWLPLAGGIGLAMCLVLALVNYGSLTGSPSAIANALPMVFVPVILGAFLYAFWLRAKKPAIYAKVASSERRTTSERRAMRTNYTSRYCIIGAGPGGLIMARQLLQEGVPFDCFERHSDVGGIWDMQNPGTPMYESAHFISSKWTSYFYGFPMPDDFPDYPSHRQILDYIRAFARAFGLYKHITFNTAVTEAMFVHGQWHVTLSTGETRLYAGVIAAPGVTWHPNMPSYPSQAAFTGEIRHSVTYRGPDEFRGKSVLVVGAGNSGVDIACDAARSAHRAYLSVRRGYRFVPKHMFGIPADLLFSGAVPPPRGVAMATNINAMLDTLSGDLTRFGLPKPDHDALASHPIMNTEILHRLAHGDILAKPDIDHFRSGEVVFKDGSAAQVDLVLFATGYDYRLPFFDAALFEWKQGRPQLYMNTIHRTLPGLYIMGFSEFADAGYRRFDEMAQLILIDIHARETGAGRDWLAARVQNHFPDLRGGKTYIDSARHANYVDVETYRAALAEIRHHLGWPDLSDASFAAPAATPAPQKLAETVK